MTTIQCVELGVLGPLQARRDGAPVMIPGAKPRATLTMLGLHGGAVVSDDTLIDLLWGDQPPRTAAKALQTHISALRRSLGDGFVLTEGTGWILTTTEVDATRYKAATKAGRDAAAAGDTTLAVLRFEEALSLWRGIPELPDSRRGISERTRWIEGHAALVEDRADALLATGRAAEIIGELEAAVAEAPLRERRWAQLILALYRAGRQGEALAAYQRARAQLADELGVDPGPDLRRLADAIIAQDSELEHHVTQHVPSVTRAVTFLLTDIEGSTAAWEADATAMAVALARHDELAEQVVTSRGGRLIKTRGEGDATFSVFDRPSAGAAAAMELQEAVLGEPWALREPIRIRVALHTGEVELRDGDYFGRAVNRAARLRSLAAGGQILCSGATAELVIDTLPDDVVLADLGMRQLRNLPRPEHVFELRWHTAEPPEETADEPLQRPGLPAVLTGPGRFVGRDHELEALAAAWQTPLAGGIHAMLIAGEPGVGKTRLAGEWSRQVYAQGAVVLYGRSDEDLGAPYQPFAEALRSLVPCIDARRLRGLRGVEALIPLIPGLTEVLPDLCAPARADPDTERYALFDAVVAVLELASASAPVVLILDDLHWAAKPTLLLLRHLLRFGDHTRVQVVATYRSTDLDRAHPLAAMLADLHRDGTANRLALGGLDESDVSAYVADAGYDDEELARALASVTGGNPFFLIEALRHVQESGGVWDPSTLPQGVREAVSRRLSRLPTETNKALAAAAVVGSRFALDLVERVTDQDLVDAFDEACKAGIVVEEPGGRYRFNHAIVRQSLLAELASVRRMRLHQRIATTLEATSGEDEELLGELAYHYFECAWAGNAAKAVDYCRRAADQAMARLAYEGAADLYDHALHALDEVDEELADRDEQAAELLIARCEALLAAGDVTSASGAVSQLHSATVDSARLAAWATCFDGQLSMLVHPERLDEVETALGAAADRLAEIGDADGEAKAYTVQSGCLARLGRIGDCELALDRALTAARRAHAHRRVNAVLAGAPLAALWGPNPVPRAGGRCLDVVRLLRITTDSPAVEATSTRCQAVLEAFRGRAAAARRMIDSARRTVTELGLRHALLEVEQFAGIIELVVGDPAAAEPHLRQAYRGFRRMGLDADTAETAALLGRACLALGRDAEADELCSESERLAGHALKASIAWRTLRALLSARRGNHAEARRMAEAAVGLAERTDALVDHGDACLALATVLGAAGDSVGAHTSAERASELYERKGAAALVDKARAMFGERIAPPAETVATAVDREELDALHARSEEVHVPVRHLKNKAARVIEQVFPLFAARDWHALAQAAADNYYLDDRRRTVNTGIRHGREAGLRELQAAAEVGFTLIESVAVATRGERLVLTQFRAASRDPEAIQSDALNVFEIDAQDKVVAVVVFDLDDFDSAIAELDTRYLAGEAREYAHAWSVITTCYAAFNRHEFTAPDWASIDHRRARAFAPGELTAYMHATWDLAPNVNVYVKAVHRLSSHGAVVTQVVRGTSQEGFDAEWREVVLITVEGDRFNRCEVFDEADLDTALGRFEELQPPQAHTLGNAASLVSQSFVANFAAHNWDAMQDQLADDYYQDDHRSVVNAGIRIGRDAALTNMRAVADLDIADFAVSDVATRGKYLVLTRTIVSFRDKDSEAFCAEQLDVGEIDSDGRLAASVTFDAHDLDGAIAELDARYVAGEAAAYARTWEVILQAFAAFNAHELPSTTTDWVNIDHRRGRAFSPGDLIPYIHAAWNLMPQATIHVAEVHRLNSVGAVVTQVLHGTSPDGFDAEWLEVNLLTVDGDRISRSELFDEDDLGAALARFDQLSPPARRLDNPASRVAERFASHFAARDWDAMAEMVAEDISNDDRRRMVGSGLRHGREAQLADGHAVAELFTSWTMTPIATRGSRLVLVHSSFRNGDPGSEAALAEVLHLLEIDADERATALISFDVDDLNAAFAELDGRYLAGEAAAHAHTWSAITDTCAALNRYETPTVDWVNVDHRRGTPFASSNLAAVLQSLWDLTPEFRIAIEAVHRLSDLGAVITHCSQGSSPEGGEVEWRMIQLLIVEGGRLARCELFDEDSLDAALARFEELQQQPRRLENAVSRLEARFLKAIADRDWDTAAELLTDDVSTDDRRALVGIGIRHGKDTVIADWRATADVGVRYVEPTVIATRGERLVLSSYRFRGHDRRSEGFRTDVLGVLEIDSSQKGVAGVMFDLDDFGAAVAELDARYLHGEAATYARTWSAITGGFAALNRGETPLVTGDFVDIDHRAGATIGPGSLIDYLRVALADTVNNVIYVEAVHRLTDLGAVVTHVSKGATPEGQNVEWHMVDVLTVDGDLISRCELFDGSDLDAALGRFEDLQTQTRRLANTASQVHGRNFEYFRARDWIQMTELLTEDSLVDDRRHVTSSGFWNGRDAVVANLRALADAAPVAWEAIATRGDRLALTRICSPNRDPQHGEFSSDMLILAEIDTTDRIAAQIPFEPDDLDAALAELDARYLAGEAAPYAHTWKLVAAGYAAFSRREVAATTPDWVSVDHRRGAGFESGGMAAYLQAAWEDSPDTRIHIAAVHRLDNLGAVVSHVAHGISLDGIEAEWRDINVLTVEGDLISRSELFSEADLATALALFEELHPKP